MVSNFIISFWSLDSYIYGVGILGYAQLIDKDVAIERLLPCVRDLVADENQHARAALAKEVSGLALIVGQMP